MEERDQAEEGLRSRYVDNFRATKWEKKTELYF